MNAQRLRSAAWPLALVYVVLVVYASLYPFSGWRDQGLPWSEFMGAPWPKRWYWLDLGLNVLGYVPLSCLMMWAGLRTWPHSPTWRWALATVLLCAGLSMLMEFAQQFLPMRVPSMVDWWSNSLGGGLGVALAWMMARMGWVRAWERFRRRWTVQESSASLALLVIWPFALLFPVSVPMGLGQVAERLHRFAWAQLEDSVAEEVLAWLPELEIWEAGALSPFAEMLVVWLGLCAPIWLAGSVLQTVWSRLISAFVLIGLAVCFTTLSTALSFGPIHALAWLGHPAQLGLLLAWVCAAASCKLSGRSQLLLSLLAALLGLFLVNQASANAYQLQNLMAWEQGQFMRFHGLSQWLGWLWPYALLVHLIRRLSSQRDL